VVGHLPRTCKHLALISSTTKQTRKERSKGRKERRKEGRKEKDNKWTLYFIYVKGKYEDFNSKLFWHLPFIGH
jgi:hypothetical protein